LTNLDCSYNQLTELDISNNYELCSGTWDYFDFDHNPGDGVSTFPVKAWFDNNSIPEYFSHLIYINYSWYWNGNEITPYFYTE
jgi:Leucine-rich repeat (LRR) protein